MGRKRSTFVDKKEAGRSFLLPCCLLVCFTVASWLGFASLCLAASKSRNEKFVQGHNKGINNVSSILLKYNVFTLEDLSKRNNGSASADETASMIASDVAAWNCLHEDPGFIRAFVLSIETQTTSNPHSLHPCCLDTPLLFLSQVFVAFLLRGTLCGFFLWKMLSGSSRGLFEFDRKILVEEIRQSASKRISVLHFKLQKQSKASMSSVTVTARLIWINAKERKRRISSESINDSLEDGDGIFLNNPSNEESDPPKLNLELSYDKTGPSRTHFHAFPWPLVLFHRINPQSPLWKCRQSLSTKQTPEFDIEFTVKGCRGIDSFSETCKYGASSMTFLDEFVSPVVLARPLDVDANFCIHR